MDDAIPPTDEQLERLRKIYLRWLDGWEREGMTPEDRIEAAQTLAMFDRVPDRMPEEV